MQQSELLEALAYWQGVLGLKDWDIQLQMVPWHTQPDDGQIEFQTYKKKAVVKMRESAQFGDQRNEPLEVLVHELVHLVLLPFDAYAPPSAVEEPVVWQIVRALLSLRSEFQAQQLLDHHDPWAGSHNQEV